MLTRISPHPVLGRCGRYIDGVIPELENLLVDTSGESLATWPMDRLRSVRAECADGETAVSFARRLSQGRLDIVGHEVRRRQGDATGDVNELLFELPDILTDGAGGAAGMRRVTVEEPGEVAEALIARLDAIASPSDLAGVSELDDARLATLVADLGDVEQALSGIRRQLFDRIDDLQGEIARRYRDGEASVDSLLS